MDIQSEGVTRLENLSIYGGLISDSFGAGLRTTSTTELSGVKFEANHAIGMNGSDGSSVGGGGGGGGAAGLGGAIYSFDAYVTIEAGESGCIFNDNIVSGGNGGNGRGNGGSFTGNGGTGGGFFGGQGGYAAAGSAGGYASGGGGGGGNYTGGIGGLGGFGGGGGGGGATTPVAMAAMVAHHPLVAGTVASDAVALRAAEVAEQPSVACLCAQWCSTVGTCEFSNNVASGGNSGRNRFGGPSAAAGGSYGSVFTYGTVHDLSDTVTYDGNVSTADTQIGIITGELWGAA